MDFACTQKTANIVGVAGVVGISVLPVSHRSSAVLVDQNQLTICHPLNPVLAIVGFRVIPVICHHLAATD